MIATSHFVAEKIREYCGREAIVVHPVIHMKNEGRRMKVEKTDSATVTLFTHGRLEAGKGIDTLVRVFQALRHNDKNIQLMLF